MLSTTTHFLFLYTLSKSTWHPTIYLFSFLFSSCVYFFPFSLSSVYFLRPISSCLLIPSSSHHALTYLANISLASRAERGIKVLLPYICTFTFGSSLLACTVGKTRCYPARLFADFLPGLAFSTDIRLAPAFSPQPSASRTDRHQGSTHRKPAFPRTSPACSTNFPCFLLIQSECNNF